MSHVSKKKPQCAMKDRNTRYSIRSSNRPCDRSKDGSEYVNQRSRGWVSNRHVVFCLVLLKYTFLLESLQHLQHVAESSKSSADKDDGALESRCTVNSSLSGRRSSGSTDGTGGSSILSGASINRGSSGDLLSGGGS